MSITRQARLESWTCGQCGEEGGPIVLFEGGNGDVRGTASVCVKCISEALVVLACEPDGASHAKFERDRSTS